MIRKITVILCFLVAGCSNDTQQQVDKPQVTVVKATKQATMQYLEYPGVTEAISTVDIRARVEGFLVERNFVEGQDVAQGDLLFVIDPRSFELELERAEAELEKAVAQVAYYDKELERMSILVNQGAISKEQYDLTLEEARAATADLEAKTADVGNAKLNLSYTAMHAPIDGRIGKTYVNVGNLVGGDRRTELATVVQLDPMYIYFSPPERELGKLADSAQRQLPVKVTVLGSQESLRGTVDFVNNVVDKSTSTISLRAVIDNADKRLLPGTYVQVKVILATDVKEIVIPQQAVIGGQGFNYVYVVGDDNQVVQKKVELGQVQKKAQVILSGLTVGEKVVVQGMQNLKSGESVEWTVQSKNDLSKHHER